MEAIDDIGAVLPFRLAGIDSDNGSEFINHQLLAYCDDHHITFTRGRPYRKNDSAHVEQKNWAIVRHAVGSPGNAPASAWSGPCSTGPAAAGEASPGPPAADNIDG